MQKIVETRSSLSNTIYIYVYIHDNSKTLTVILFPSSDCTITELRVLLYQYISREIVFTMTGLTAAYEWIASLLCKSDPLLVTSKSCCGGCTPIFMQYTMVSKYVHVDM